MEDIKKFQDHLRDTAQRCYTTLENGYDYAAWRELGRCTMVLLLTFNRRRVGNVDKIKLISYQNRQSIQGDQLQAYTRLERLLADNFHRMETRGKRGRRVALLLSVQHREYLDMFVRYREQAGVEENNKFLFGTAHRAQHLDACKAIRDYSSRCGAQNPQRLRGTYLRKQVATVSQMLNLSDNEIQQIADFMGHDIAIHRQFYRTPELSLQVTKLAKFFMAVDDTDLEKYRGKSIDDLEVLDPRMSLTEEPATSDEEPDPEVVSPRLKTARKASPASRRRKGLHTPETPGMFHEC